MEANQLTQNSTGMRMILVSIKGCEFASTCVLYSEKSNWQHLEVSQVFKFYCPTQKVTATSHYSFITVNSLFSGNVKRI